jgi:phosphoserine phosphatase
METLQTIRRHVDGTRAVIIDLDKTLVKGRVAEALGLWYLNREWDNRNYRKVAIGAIGMAKIPFLLRFDRSDTAEAKGIQLFYATLIRAGIGKKTEMQENALKYLKGNSTEQVSEIIRFASKPKFLATISGSVASQVAAGYFQLDGFTSNVDLFDSGNGQLKGIKIRIGDGSQKLEAVEKMLRVHGISLKNCTAIGDGLPDIPLLRTAGLSIASPYATEEVRAITKIQLEQPAF